MVETYCHSPPTRGRRKSKTQRDKAFIGYLPPELPEDEQPEAEGDAAGEGEEEGEEDAVMSTRLSAVLGNYVEGKVKQWELEMQEVMNIFTNSITRLHRLVKVLLSVDGGTDGNVQRVLYIVSFLFKAMKQSHAHGGVGAELMWKLFKDIMCNLQALNEIRIQPPPEYTKDQKPGEPNDEDMEEKKQEYVSQYLMKLFSFSPNSHSITEMIPSGEPEDLALAVGGVPSPAPLAHIPSPSPSFLSSDALLIRRFEEAITDTLSAELRYGIFASNRLQENKQIIKVAIGKQIKEEHDAVEAFSVQVRILLYDLSLIHCTAV